jgi:Tfp pilus assembly protein PilZ
MSEATGDGAHRPFEPREERVTINKEFESFDAFISEYVTNISRSGVFVRAKKPLPIGTVVNLHFTVIMDDIETIEGTGEVVRVDDEGMGVVFTEISTYSKDLIDKLLTKRLATATASGR